MRRSFALMLAHRAMIPDDARDEPGPRAAPPDEQPRVVHRNLTASQQELHSANHRLQAELEELERAADDLRNLLDSTQIATLFLDRHHGASFGPPCRR